MVSLQCSYGNLLPSLKVFHTCGGTGKDCGKDCVYIYICSLFLSVKMSGSHVKDAVYLLLWKEFVNPDRYIILGTLYMSPEYSAHYYRQTTDSLDLLENTLHDMVTCEKLLYLFHIFARIWSTLMISSYTHIAVMSNRRFDSVFKKWEYSPVHMVTKWRILLT